MKVYHNLDVTSKISNIMFLRLNPLQRGQDLRCLNSNIALVLGAIL